MSKEYPCVYYDNEKCKKFSDDEVTSYCVMGPCHYETPSNSDRIRAMSDEELARFLTWNVPDCINFCNDARCGCKWNCKHGEGLHFITNWLRQPAEGAKE